MRSCTSWRSNSNLHGVTGLVKAGSPSLGQDPLDSHIWYYDGTPAAQIFVALDYVLPTHANFSTPDLILAGPNYGLNLGPFFYTLSGTMGAAYAAIQRGIPAIAYSAAYPTQTSYEWTNTTTAAGLQDPATIAARLAANLAQGLIDKANGSRILPLGYGLSVNIPYITSFKDDSCVNPPFILTRMTGGAVTNKAVYNANTGLVSTQNTEADGLNECINGDCGLVGETVVLDSGCFASVSVFTVDYDAPFSGERLNVTSPYELVPSIVQLQNSTVLVGGLDANGTVTGGSGSSTSTASAATSTLSNSATPTNSAAEVRLPLANFVVLLMISILM